MKLPTIEDVMRQHLWEREQILRIAGNRKEPFVTKIFQSIIPKILAVCELASISGDAIVSERQMEKMFFKYHGEGRNLQKSSKKTSKRKGKSYRISPGQHFLISRHVNAKIPYFCAPVTPGKSYQSWRYPFCLINAQEGKWR